MRIIRQSFKIASHITTLLLLTVLSFRLWRNLHFLRWARLQASKPPPIYPRVSVLIPARNEARTITACVTSLLCQDYPNFEVIVLNDASTDTTAKQLEALVAHYPQLKVLTSTDNPAEGWNGKSYACHRLAEQASGDWLLFTDADTQHTPQSILKGIAQAVTLEVSFLSALPHQETLTWSEQILVPFIMNFLPLIGLNLESMWRGKSNRTAANGQYLLMRASGYYAVGGHAAISSKLVDDFALARLFQSNHHKIALVDGTNMLKCRMYHNAHEVWDGFSKNLMLGLSTSSSPKSSLWLAPVFGWGYACLFMLPYLLLLFDKEKQLTLIEIGWLGLLRMLMGWELKRPLAESLTTPLAAWGVMVLGMRATYQHFRKQKITWKNRSYPA